MKHEGQPQIKEESFKQITDKYNEYKNLLADLDNFQQYELTSEGSSNQAPVYVLNGILNSKTKVIEEKKKELIKMIEKYEGSGAARDFVKHILESITEQTL